MKTEHENAWEQTALLEVREDLPRIYKRIDCLENMGSFRRFLHKLLNGSNARDAELKRLNDELELKLKRLQGLDCLDEYK